MPVLLSCGCNTGDSDGVGARYCDAHALPCSRPGCLHVDRDFLASPNHMWVCPRCRARCHYPGCSVRAMCQSYVDAPDWHCNTHRARCSEGECSVVDDSLRRDPNWRCERHARTCAASGCVVEADDPYACEEWKCYIHRGCASSRCERGCLGPDVSYCDGHAKRCDGCGDALTDRDVSLSTCAACVSDAATVARDDYVDASPPAPVPLMRSNAVATASPAPPATVPGLAPPTAVPDFASLAAGAPASASTDAGPAIEEWLRPGVIHRDDEAGGPATSWSPATVSPVPPAAPPLARALFTR